MEIFEANSEFPLDEGDDIDWKTLVRILQMRIIECNSKFELVCLKQKKISSFTSTSW